MRRVPLIRFTKSSVRQRFFGRENETGPGATPGITHFAPFYRYKFDGGYFVGGALSRVIAELAELTAVEIESGAGQRSGGLHETEGWVALDVR